MTRANSRRVAVLGVARNCERHLPAALGNLANLASCYDEARFVFAVSDSTDGTATRLQEWLGETRQGTVLQLGALEPQFPMRPMRIAANRKEFDVVVKKVERAAKAEDFEAATDELSLFILGKGRLPEGVDAKEVIQRVRLSYVEFDEPCFDNGQGKMICRGPRSSRAENAYNAFVGVLRGAAPKNVGASGSNGALRGF